MISCCRGWISISITADVFLGKAIPYYKQVIPCCEVVFPFYKQVIPCCEVVFPFYKQAIPFCELVSLFTNK
ncbi:hypothetical protein BN1088_1430050 [Sphingobacterium sp. PM2-P1-29]|nr:hypothetical protein BN1088_1430050 [Sphingobacterium sp. PM2-P1-29]